MYLDGGVNVRYLAEHSSILRRHVWGRISTECSTYHFTMAVIRRKKRDEGKLYFHEA